jgi:hypothetical protein
MKKIGFLIAILLVGCSTSISTKLVNKNFQKLEDSSQVIVLDTNEELPANSELIGDLKIGDSGFTTDCGYDKVIADATNAAKNSGANIVKITEVKKPSTFGSTCYRIKAKLYRNLDAESLSVLAQKRSLKNKSRLPENADYAVIYFYRPSNGAGSLLGYKIKDVNDSVVGRLRNGEKFAYKTKKFGLQTFYGALETKEEVKINVVKGNEYFVRCAVNMGIVLGRPEINLTENFVGMKEYDLMK